MRTNATAGANYHLQMNVRSASGSDDRNHKRLITDRNGNTSWLVDCGVAKFCINVDFTLILSNPTT